MKASFSGISGAIGRNAARSGDGDVRARRSRTAPPPGALILPCASSAAKCCVDRRPQAMPEQAEGAYMVVAVGDEDRLQPAAR